jgi:hypothetical protein
MGGVCTHSHTPTLPHTFLMPRRPALLPGLLVSLFGAWLLARNLDLRPPGLAALWPAALVVAGLALLARYWAGGRRETGLVFSGVLLALLGAGLLAAGLGALGRVDAPQLWPGALAVLGAAFLAQWLARRAERRLLWIGALLLLAGVALLALRSPGLDPARVAAAVRLWPVAVIALGLARVVRGARRRARG